MFKQKRIITMLLILSFLLSSLVNTEQYAYADSVGSGYGFEEHWDKLSYAYENMNVLENTGSILRITSTTYDPQISMYNIGSFDPNMFRYLEIRYKLDIGTPSTSFEIFFTNRDYTTVFTQDQSVGSSQLLNDGQWHTCSLDLWSNPRYLTGGNITGWRYDWASTANTTMELDYIRLVQKPIGYEEQWDSIKYSSDGTNVISNTGSTIKVSSTTFDPMINMYNIGSFNPNVYRYIEIKYKMDAGAAPTSFEIFFTNNDYPTVYTQEQSVGSNQLAADGQWHTYYLDLWNNPRYRSGGNITGWRYDWANAVNTTMELDYIRLVQKPIAYEEQWDSIIYYSDGTNVISNTGSTIKVSSSTNDPMMYMYNIGSFDPNVFRYIEIKYKMDTGTAPTAFEIFFTNNDYPTVYTQEQYVGSNQLAADGQWHTYYLDLWSNPRYLTGGNITGFRYDWATANGVTIEFDYIRLVATDVIKPVDPSFSLNQLDNSSFKVYAFNLGIDTSEVIFPTWTTNNGQDDLIWHKGMYIGNNNWEVTIPLEDHNAESGEYLTHIYQIDRTGSSQLIGWTCCNIAVMGTVYQYDSNNRLIQILKDGVPYYIYTYDCNGNLIAKQKVQ